MLGRWRRVPLGVSILAHRARRVNLSFDFLSPLSVAVIHYFVRPKVCQVILARVPASRLAVRLRLIK